MNKEKYKLLRPSIKNGSIILVRGNSFLTRTIEWADSSYYSHALVVFKTHGDRLLCLQSMASGVVPYFLSREVYNNVDFCVLNLKVNQQKIDDAVNTVFSEAEAGIRYDFAELVKILLKKKLGFKFKNMQDGNENICSVFAGYTFASRLIECYKDLYHVQGYLSPGDLLRASNEDEISILGNNSK